MWVRFKIVLILLMLSGVASSADRYLVGTGARNWNDAAGNLITISSITTAQHTLNYTGTGVVGCDYLNLSYSAATPNAFYAGANSTNSGNNTNWLFVAKPNLPITYGSEVSNLTAPISQERFSMASLSSSLEVTGYYTSFTGNQCRAGTVSASTVTLGSAYEFDNSVLATSVEIVPLSSTTFAVVYGGNDLNLYAKIGTVSGTAISYGSRYTLSTSGVDNIAYLDVAPLSTSSFVVVYRDDDGAQYRTSMRVCTVSGTIITTGNRAELQYATNISKVSVSPINSSSYIVGYADSNNSYYGTTMVCTVSGTAITTNTKYVFYSGSVSSNPVSISANGASFLVAYGKSNVVAGTVSGTVVSYGTPLGYNLTDTNTGIVSVKSISVGRYVMLDYSSGTSVTNSRIMNVSGTTITNDTPTQVAIATTYSSNIGILDPLKFCALYYKGGTNDLMVRVGTIPASGKKINGVTLSKWNNTAITKWNNQ